MITLSKTQRRWLIGGLGTLAGLTLLCGLSLVAFFKFIDWVRKVPPESTQLTLYNDTNERLRIDKFYFGNELLIDEESFFLEVKIPGKFTWYFYDFFRDQPEISREIFVSYTGLDSGETWQAKGTAQRLPDRPCKFVAILRVGGGEISSCRYNELQDFEGD